MSRAQTVFARINVRVVVHPFVIKIVIRAVATITK